MIITFLGTGTSHGVPSIDCMMRNFERCPKNVCRQAKTDSKHRRTRSSILIEFNQKHLLIDVSADFRQQALREKIPKIDAVLITHKHADHINGIPDFRSYTRQQPVDFYGSKESLACIENTFDYIFDPDTFVGGGIPRIKLKTITKSFTLWDEKIVPIPVSHGSLKGCFGYRIGKLAYIPDMKDITEEALALLKDLDYMILNCLRIEREHSTHLILEQSIELARKIGPKRCYFIHMCHDVDYVADSVKLDPWMEFAWDGLRVELDD